MKIMRACAYGIHDISRTELDKKHNLPRCKIPLELGIDLGFRNSKINPLNRKKQLVRSWPQPKGDVWKFGETINPGTRYAQKFLTNTGEGLQMRAIGSFRFKFDARAAERSEIISYEGRFGRLPAGNKQRN